MGEKERVGNISMLDINSRSSCKRGYNRALKHNGSARSEEGEWEAGRDFSKLSLNMGCFKASLAN